MRCKMETFLQKHPVICNLFFDDDNFKKFMLTFHLAT